MISAFEQTLFMKLGVSVRTVPMILEKLRRLINLFRRVRATQPKPAFVPCFPVALEPTLGNRPNEEVMGRDMEGVLTRHIVERYYIVKP